VQGALAFHIRLLPQTLSTTSQLFVAGPLRLVYHAPQSQLQATYRGVSVMVSLPPDTAWHAVAFAWQAELPCVMLDQSDWLCASEADVVRALGDPRFQDTTVDFDSATFVLGGVQANGYDAGILADVDNVCLYANSTSLSPDSIRSELMSSALEDHLQCAELDPCGNKQTHQSGGFVHSTVSSPAALPIVKLNFDSGSSYLPFSFADVLIEAQNARFVLSGAPTHENLCITDDTFYSYRLPIVLSSDDEEVTFESSCGSSIQLLSNSDGMPGAPLPRIGNKLSLKSGFSVFLTTNPSGTDIACYLYIQQGWLVTKRWIQMKHVNSPPTLPPDHVRTEVKENGILINGKAFDLDDNSLDIIIAAVPEMGTIVHQGSVLRVGEKITASESQQGFIWQLQWVLPSASAREPAGNFAYVVSDGCAQTAVQRVDLNSSSMQENARVVFGPSGLALCFDGNNAVQIHGVDLSQSQSSSGYMNLIEGFSMSLWFKTSHARPGLLATVGPFRLTADRLKGITFSIGMSHSHVNVARGLWNDGAWHHVVAAWDPRLTELQLSLDSQEVQSKLIRWQDSNTVRRSRVSDLTATIGEGFTGCIDEFAVVTHCADLPGSPQGLMQQVHDATAEGPISDACQGPVYLRFNRYDVKMTNEWTNSKAVAQLLTGLSDALPTQAMSSVFPPVSIMQRIPVESGGSFTITPEVYGLGVLPPKIQIHASFEEDPNWHLFLKGSDMQGINGGEVVEFPVGSQIVVNTTTAASGSHTVWYHGVGNSENQMEKQTEARRYDLYVEGPGQAPTCTDTKIVSDSESVSTIEVPRCFERGNPTFEIMVVAKPELGILTYADSTSGTNAVIDSVPFLVKAKIVQFWKPATVMPLNNDRVSFVAVNSYGQVSNEVSVEVTSTPNHSVLAATEAAMSFIPDSPGAAFPALNDMFSPDDFARFQSSRHLPGIALQLSTSAAIAATMHLVETPAYVIAISKMSSVVLRIGNLTIINLPVSPLNDGGWHPLTLEIQNEVVTLTVDDTQASVELSAQQFNMTLRAMRDSPDLITLGQTANGELSEGFHGRLRSIYVTTDWGTPDRIPLTMTNESFADAAADAILGDWSQTDNGWGFVVDEDSSLEINLLHTLSMSPANITVVDLPASGQLGVVNTTGFFSYIYKPHTVLPSHTVIYETAVNECSDKAEAPTTFLVQEMRADKASTPFPVNIHINCKDDLPELLNSRFTVHVQQNSVQRISLDEIVRDVDGDVRWEMTAPPSNGHLLLEDGEAYIPLVNRTILPQGKTELLFRPLLNTYGAPYTSFSLLARDQHTELPEIEVRVNVENGLAVSQENSNAGVAIISAMNGAWGPALFDTWFKQSALSANATSVSCHMLLLLGLGDICSIPEVDISLLEDIDIEANRWHRATIAFTPPLATVAINSKLCIQAAWQVDVQPPSTRMAPPDQETVSMEAIHMWGLPSSTMQTMHHLREGNTQNLDLLSKFDFYQTTNGFTFDAARGLTAQLNNVNRTQLHMPVPLHVYRPMVQETPLVNDYGDFGTAGHALLLNGDTSITIPVLLNTSSFTVEGWFKTGQASGQTSALLDIGAALVVGWTRKSGLTIAVPATGYSLPTNTSFNDGAWHYLQAVIEWMPAGNLQEPRFGHSGKLRLALSIDAHAATVGYIPYSPLANWLVIGKASGFPGYANLIDEIKIFSGARGATQAINGMRGQLSSKLDLLASLSFSEGSGTTTLEQVSGNMLPIEVGNVLDMPLNTAWVVSTAPTQAPILQLPANSTTTVALGVDADSDNISAIISAEHQLPDPAVAALLLPGCISPILNSCSVRASHLPISLPLAAATLSLTEAFGMQASAQYLLSYTLSDGHRESGPYSLYAQPASVENKPPLMGSVLTGNPIGAHSPRDIPAHVVNLTGLAVDPEGQTLEYFVSIASGSAWLHSYDHTTPSRVGPPLHIVQHKYNAGRMLQIGARKVKGWYAAEDIVVIIPVTSQDSIGLHVIACDQQDGCSDAVIDIALDSVRILPSLGCYTHAWKVHPKGLQTRSCRNADYCTYMQAILSLCLHAVCGHASMQVLDEKVCMAQRSGSLSCCSCRHQTASPIDGGAFQVEQPGQ
jgi:hypothetical protein